MLVIVLGVFLRLLDKRGNRIGVERVARVKSINVFRTIERSITFTWICTKMSGS